MLLEKIEYSESSKKRAVFVSKKSNITWRSRLENT